MCRQIVAPIQVGDLAFGGTVVRNGITMTTHDPLSDFERMRRLAQETDEDALDIRLNGRGLFPTDPTQRFAVNQAGLNKVMVKTFNAIDGRLQSMANDIGQAKGGHARAEVSQEAGVIALDMGLGYVRTVDKYELALWAQKHSNSGLDAATLRSFREADLVVMATDGPDIVYIAVEVSFTANKSDTDRAQRNAELLTRFTGIQAQAAIASVKNDDYVTEQVDQGLVHWHSIARRSLEPD